MLEEGLFVAPEPHDGALEAYLSRAHVQKRFGLGAWDFRALLSSSGEHKETVTRLDADEEVSVGAGWEVALNHVSDHALLFSDQASEGGGDQEAEVSPNVGDDGRDQAATA